MGNSRFSPSSDNPWLRYTVFSGVATVVLLGALVGSQRYSASEQAQNALAARLPVTWAKAQAQFYTTDTAFRAIVSSAPDTWMANPKKFDRIEASFEKNREALIRMLSDVRPTSERQGQHAQLSLLDGDMRAYKTLTNTPDEVTLAHLNSLVNAVNQDFDALENSAAASLERNDTRTNTSTMLLTTVAIAFGLALCALIASGFMYYKSRNGEVDEVAETSESPYMSGGALDILNRFTAATNNYDESPVHPEPHPQAQAIVADAAKSVQLADMVTEVQSAQQALQGEPLAPQPMPEPQLQAAAVQAVQTAPTTSEVPVAPPAPATQAAVAPPVSESVSPTPPVAPHPAASVEAKPVPENAAEPKFEPAPAPQVKGERSLMDRLAEMGPAIQPEAPAVPIVSQAPAAKDPDPLFAKIEESGHKHDVHIHEDHVHGVEYIAQAEETIAHQPPRPMEPASAIDEDAIQIDTTINQFTQQTQRLVSALFSLNAVADSTMSLAGTLADALDRSPDRAEAERVSAELHRITTAMMTTVQQLSGNTIRMQNQVAHMMKTIDHQG
jgi:hypothetical protein